MITSINVPTGTKMLGFTIFSEKAKHEEARRTHKYIHIQLRGNTNPKSMHNLIMMLHTAHGQLVPPEFGGARDHQLGGGGGGTVADCQPWGGGGGDDDAAESPSQR